MTLESLNSLICRVFFAVSFLLLAVSLLEAGARQFGYTILRHSFEPGRLLEYAVIMLVFVLALLLRQIREGMRKA